MTTGKVPRRVEVTQTPTFRHQKPTDVMKFKLHQGDAGIDQVKTRCFLITSAHTGAHHGFFFFYIVRIFHWCYLHRISYCMQQQKNTSKLKLTHSKTRINPRGNFSTWNVPVDASCMGTQRTDKGAHLNHQLTTHLANLADNHTHVWVKNHLHSLDQRCPFQLQATFCSDLFDWTKHTLKPQARTRLMSLSRLVKGSRLRFRLRTERPESS